MKGKEKIIGLDSELDKLRNKELSFGCIIECEDVWKNTKTTEIVIKTEQEQDKEEGNCTRLYFLSGDELLTSQVINTFSGSVLLRNEKDREVNVIGHPLTRGRIVHLSNTIEVGPGKRGDMDTMYERVANIEKWVSIFGSIKIFLTNHKLFDQNELQRMQHEKRPELKGLLKQFSDYL